MPDFDIDAALVAEPDEFEVRKTDDSPTYHVYRRGVWVGVVTSHIGRMDWTAYLVGRGRVPMRMPINAYGMTKEDAIECVKQHVLRSEVPNA